MIDKKLTYNSCEDALREQGQILECKSGCIGVGSCISSCKLKAISINEYGVAEINMEKCVGCKLCIKACPQNLIGLINPDMNIIPKCSNEEKGAIARKECEVSCISCKICERNCPVDAIKIIDDHAVIDEDNCVTCGMCAMKCPRGTIADTNRIFTA